MGIIYGTPLANILEKDWQETFLALGYVGLILIIFEGTIIFKSFRSSCSIVDVMQVVLPLVSIFSCRTSFLARWALLRACVFLLGCRICCCTWDTAMVFSPCTIAKKQNEANFQALLRPSLLELRSLLPLWVSLPLSADEALITEHIQAPHSRLYRPRRRLLI